MTTFRENSK